MNEEIRKQIRERTVSFVVAAFGLIAGLAWNDAIKALTDEVLPISRDTLLGKFVYAGILTIILITISILIAKIFQRKEEKK